MSVDQLKCCEMLLKNVPALADRQVPLMATIALLLIVPSTNRAIKGDRRNLQATQESDERSKTHNCHPLPASWGHHFALGRGKEAVGT